MNRPAAALGSVATPPSGADAPTGTLPELLHPRRAQAWLGVEMQALPGGQAGVLVKRVLLGSPAAEAGIQQGDRLLSWNGSTILGPAQLQQSVQGGGVVAVSLGLERGPQARLLQLKLEGAPEYEDLVRLQLVGRRAPELSRVETVAGHYQSLAALRGKVVLLDFWASFCGVCRYLAPTLESWHRELSPQGLELVGITTDRPEEAARVSRAWKSTYTQVFDQDEVSLQSYLARELPLLVLVDRQGIIRDAVVGYSESRMLATHELLLKLLSEHGEESRP